MTYTTDNQELKTEESLKLDGESPVESDQSHLKPHSSRQEPPGIFAMTQETPSPIQCQNQDLLQAIMKIQSNQ